MSYQTGVGTIRLNLLKPCNNRHFENDCIPTTLFSRTSDIPQHPTFSDCGYCNPEDLARSTTFYMQSCFKSLSFIFPTTPILTNACFLTTLTLLEYR